MLTAAILSRLGRMSLDAACAMTFDEAEEWIEHLVEAKKLLNNA